MEWAEFYRYVGLFGVGLYIVNYTLLQLNFIRGNGALYPTITLVAACSILVSMLAEFNLPSAVVNGLYVIISIVGLLRIALFDSRIRFSPAEQLLLAKHLPHLQKKSARRMFDSGHWISVSAGVVLTHQDEPISDLIYIESGGVDVLVDGRVVGRCDVGSFVGEITVMSGDPATATTIVAQDAAIFSIPASRLRALVAKDPDLAGALQNAFGADMRAKLMRANAA